MQQPAWPSTGHAVYPIAYEEVSMSTKKGFTDEERAAMKERARKS